MNDVERYEAEFDELGEYEVRRLLDLGRFNDFKNGVAIHWLGVRERAAAKAAQDEANEIARTSNALASDANALAERANTHAKIAALAAIIATLVSIGAFIVSIVSLLRR